MSIPTTPAKEPNHGTDVLAAELTSKSRITALRLGVANLLLIIAVGVGGFFAFQGQHGSTDQLHCGLKLLAGPWIGLRTTLDAPVGDPTARDLASKRMGVAIAKLQHIDDYC